MPLVEGHHYITEVDLLAGGTSFTFRVQGAGPFALRVEVAESILHLVPGIPFRVPENNAVFLYPACRHKFEELIQRRTFDQLRGEDRLTFIFDEARLDELRALIRDTRIDPWECILAFMSFSRQNIFANERIPTSVRLVAEATRLTSEQIVQLVAQHHNGPIQIVGDGFLSVTGEIDI